MKRQQSKPVTKPVAKPKRKTGRPKVLIESVQQALLDRIMEGTTVVEAAVKCGISYKTVLRKELEDDAFGRDLARARISGAASRLDAADRAIRAADTHEKVGRAREMAVHARWIASKLIPQYADRAAQTNLQVNVGADAGAASTSSARTWTKKQVSEWTFEERNQAAQQLNFTYCALGRELTNLGFPERFFEVSSGFGNAIAEHVLAGDRGQTPQALLAAPVTIDAATQPDALPPEQPAPQQTAADRRAAERLEARRQFEIANYTRELTASEREGAAELDRNDYRRSEGQIERARLPRTLRFKPRR